MAVDVGVDVKVPIRFDVDLVYAAQMIDQDKDPDSTPVPNLDSHYRQRQRGHDRYEVLKNEPFANRTGALNFEHTAAARLEDHCWGFGPYLVLVPNVPAFDVKVEST